MVLSVSEYLPSCTRVSCTGARCARRRDPHVDPAGTATTKARGSYNVLLQLFTFAVALLSYLI